MKILAWFTLFFLSLDQSSFASAIDIKSCLKQALAKGNPIYQVPEGSSTEGYNRYLAMLCDGEPAKILYNSLAGVAAPGDWNGRTRGETKILGEDGGSSMCYHITRDASGEKSNTYNCSIRLNIDSKQMGKSQSGEMTPFPVK